MACGCAVNNMCDAFLYLPNQTQPNPQERRPTTDPPCSCCCCSAIRGIRGRFSCTPAGATATEAAGGRTNEEEAAEAGAGTRWWRGLPPVVGRTKAAACGTVVAAAARATMAARSPVRCLCRPWCGCCWGCCMLLAAVALACCLLLVRSRSMEALTGEAGGRGRNRTCTLCQNKKRCQ